nr:hypothetical protein [Luteitalea pratensis]
MMLTLVLLAALAAVFLKGFREAVGLAVPIVAVYILLNLVVLTWGLGAYATGVLVLMGSAALAVTLADRRQGRGAWVGFALLTVIFAYTTVVNILERPEGLKIAVIFIVSTVLTSLVSRVLRSTELRIHSVQPDAQAQLVLREAAGAPIRVIANHPDAGAVAAFEHKLEEAEESHHFVPDACVLFIEVQPSDASAFSDQLCVQGTPIGAITFGVALFDSTDRRRRYQQPRLQRAQARRKRQAMSRCLGHYQGESCNLSPKDGAGSKHS